ncbi:hypothetical protein [Arthrobacter sp. H5]|uniref:hypothetical protein n=1 Tax=Arthrobacter sp. H5 TaxID=1267973 RepID=UPI0004B42801|nr:hypothetical protein [Arthrobacter sp. H5]
MSTHGPQSPPETSAKETAGTRTQLTVFILLLVATMLAASFPLPWKVLGLMFALAALTVGIIALVGTIRHRLPRLMRIATIAGLVASLFFTLGTGAQIILWPVVQQYEECSATALTSKAQGTCEDNLRNLDGLLSN